MTSHGERQRDTTLKFCGHSMELLDLMAQATDAGEFGTVSNIAAKLAKDLVDLSRMMMAADAIERTTR